jgi:hypothetical protein
MIVLERLVLFAGYSVIALSCGLGLVSAWTLAVDPKSRKAFLNYWMDHI